MFSWWLMVIICWCQTSNSSKLWFFHTSQHDLTVLSMPCWCHLLEKAKCFIVTHESVWFLTAYWKFLKPIAMHSKLPKRGNSEQETFFDEFYKSNHHICFSKSFNGSFLAVLNDLNCNGMISSWIPGKNWTDHNKIGHNKVDINS